MKSWTSIPFYLWKNTFKRWLEYPVSPASKILLPFLLGVLAIVVLTLFEEVEIELREQLLEHSAYSVVLDEMLTTGDVETTLHRSYEEELMWTSRYGDAIQQIRRPLKSAFFNQRPVPIISHSPASDDQSAQSNNHDKPPMLVLYRNLPGFDGELASITLGEIEAVAVVSPAPDWLVDDLGMDTALSIPIGMADPMMATGFISYTIARLNSIDEVRQFVREAESYYRAERRRVKIVSALPILENLERISGIQRIVRSLIILGCGVILAMTLGSVAWLEYRQDSYLLALLRSFGTPSAILLGHMFLENLCLVMFGVATVWLSWPALYRLGIPKLEEIGLSASPSPVVEVMDLATVAVAALVGVLLAMIPVAVGLRKAPGLTLQ